LLRLHGRLCFLDNRQLKLKIDELLHLVDMSDYAKKAIKTFSKGMLQRIGLAQALINDPELLILDEPTSGLDPIGRKEMRDLFLRLKEQGKTIIMVTHEKSLVPRFTRHLEISDGKLVLENGNQPSGRETNR